MHLDGWKHIHDFVLDTLGIVLCWSYSTAIKFDFLMICFIQIALVPGGALKTGDLLT